MSEQLVFGLDIGTRSIVGTVGYKQSLNDFTVVAQAIKMHDTRAMMDGQIHDINKVAETIEQVKRSLEKQTGKKLEEVCIAAAGRVLKTVTVHVETDFPQEVTVNTEMIRALELLGVENAYQQIKTEAKDDDTNYYCVAYTVIKYYLNDFTITNLEDHKANKIGADVLATFLPDEVIGGLYTAVEKAGLRVANLTLEPIAAIQVAIPEKFRLLNIALVDVGAGTSDISITKEGSIIAYGMIPMAGDALTEHLTGAHLVDFATAEKIKLDSNTKKKSISYKDIMGLSQKTTPAEVREELVPVVEHMTKQVAEKIKELNGGKPVSAVFIVGGGGKIAGYTESLAAHLGIPKERVALRGEEVLGFVRFLQEGIKKDPTLVTPIGICLNYYENKNNFIFVTVNGES
ncbi:MAG: pilus assembly protein PilM, partial [Lachnospiraceae bacterium]|nr:pilus assembly protein PilM [Lachnospiraceae bacterium]